MPTSPTGSTEDFVARLKSLLPVGWFLPETNNGGTLNPVLTAVLTGPAWSLAWFYSLINYVKLQTRISSATDVNLDLIGQDYFNGFLTRMVGETDNAYRARILDNLLAPKATRAAVSDAVEDLVGEAPFIFEPANTGDTGGYGTGYARTWTGLAYNEAGGYGNLDLPFQAFITVERPRTQGIGYVAGYVTLGVGNGLNQVFGTNGDSTVAPSSDVPPPFNNVKVTKCTITGGAGNKVAGFLTVPETNGTTYAIQCLVWIPPGQPLTSVAFRAENNASLPTNVVSPDLTTTGCWQRVGSNYVSSGTTTNLVLRINASANGSEIYVACARQDIGTLGLAASGGYGVGAIEWADKDMIAGTIPDSLIYSTIAAAAPAATIMWTRIIPDDDPSEVRG